ncbi:MAG: GNAT family N-acetyltransferase, partial [Kiloniellales bacterium]|nr:GNAT family N-acetyltransferase [Kiloniellales bacterium]
IVMERVFEGLGAHRLWLDVFPDNARARHVYRSMGFAEEGTLRDALRFGDGYASLVIMSMLAPEYRQRAVGARSA